MRDITKNETSLKIPKFTKASTYWTFKSRQVIKTIALVQICSETDCIFRISSPASIVFVSIWSRGRFFRLGVEKCCSQSQLKCRKTAAIRPRKKRAAFARPKIKRTLGKELEAAGRNRARINWIKVIYLTYHSILGRMICFLKDTRILLSIEWQLFMYNFDPKGHLFIYPRENYVYSAPMIFKVNKQIEKL